MIEPCKYLPPRNQGIVSIATMVLLLCSLAGCGDADQRVSIQGQVSYRDDSLTTGSLVFFPAKGRPTSTVISPEGTYSCQLPTGKYRVTVTLGVHLPAGWKEGDRIPPPDLILPPKYTSRLRTPLTASVVEGQGGAVDFSLE